MKTLRNFFSVELAKLREMNFTDKRQYIWEYYKLHIFIVCIGIFSLGYFINATFINPPKDSYLHIAWLAFHIPHPQPLETIRDNLNIIIDDPERQEVQVRCYSPTGDMHMDQALITQFHGMIMLGEMNGIITIRDDIEGLANSGIIGPIHDVLHELRVIFPDLDYGDRLITITYELSDSTQHTDVIAVYLGGSNIIAEAGLPTSGLYFSSVMNSDSHYQVAKALGLLLNQEWSRTYDY